MGYYIFWRPAWRVHRLYTSFSEHFAAEPPQGKSRDEPLPPATVLLNVVPHSIEYDRAVRQCVQAIARDYSISRQTDGEFQSSAATLKSIVEPAQVGQIELLDAFRVRFENLSLTFGIVSYLNRERVGKYMEESTRVGQIVLLDVRCDLGRLWIEPESLLHKLTELVCDEDLDIATQPEFSYRYHLRAERRDCMQLQVPESVWRTVGESFGVVIKGRGAHWIVAKDQGLSPEIAADLVHFGFDILREFLPAARSATN